MIISYLKSLAGTEFDALRGPYNGKTPNADSCKWEMASKMLYETGKPEMLRCLIVKELTEDFICL